jgi:hypothetical protein
MSHPPTGDPYQSPSGVPGDGQGYGYAPPPADTYQPYGQQPPDHQQPAGYQPLPSYPPLQGYQPELQSCQPVSGYPGYPGEGYQPQYPYGYGPRYVLPTNGLAIASLVVSVVGLVGLCAYLLGGYIGIVGLILGVVARRQIREQGTSGDGLALAGVIVGTIAAAVSIIATVLFVLALVTL